LAQAAHFDDLVILRRMPSPSKQRGNHPPLLVTLAAVDLGLGNLFAAKGNVLNVVEADPQRVEARQPPSVALPKVSRTDAETSLCFSAEQAAIE
jgi:hypothetical protein